MILKVSRYIDLETLLFPSFALPLFTRDNNVYIKRWGACSGLKIWIENNEVYIEHDSTQCIDYALNYVLGRWCSFETLSCSYGIRDERFSYVLSSLKELYPYMGVSTSPLDDIALFVSIFLSRNTDFHVNVVKWMNRMFMLCGDDWDCIVRILRERPTSIGSSYQIKQLAEVLPQYLELRDVVLASDSDTVKRELLKLKYVGPKVAFAYILFVKLDSRYAPLDVNFLTFLRQLRLVPEDCILPKKELCIRYSCDDCPSNNRCLEYIVRQYVERFAGLLQTIVYVHVKKLCKRKMCYLCPLKGVCRDADMSPQKVSTY